MEPKTQKYTSFKDLLAITEDRDLQECGALTLTREYPREERARLLGQDIQGRSYFTREELRKIHEEQNLDAALEEHGNDPDRRMNICGFPMRRDFRCFFMNHDFRTEYPGAFKSINSGKWVFAHGSQGTGKTSLACHLGWKFMEKHPTRKASFLSIKDWLNDMMPSPENGPRTVQLPQLKPFVILDDFDKFQPTDWQMLQLFRLVDYLYRRADDFHTIVTSNKSLSEIGKMSFGDRLGPTLDRIFEMSFILHLKGPSKRTSPDLEIS